MGKEKKEKKDKGEKAADVTAEDMDTTVAENGEVGARFYLNYDFTLL